MGVLQELEERCRAAEVGQRALQQERQAGAGPPSTNGDSKSGGHGMTDNPLFGEVSGFPLRRKTKSIN